MVDFYIVLWPKLPMLVIYLLLFVCVALFAREAVSGHAEGWGCFEGLCCSSLIIVISLGAALTALNDPGSHTPAWIAVAVVIGFGLLIRRSVSGEPEWPAI